MIRTKLNCNIKSTTKPRVRSSQQMLYLVMRRRSRKLGEPRRRGIDGDRDERDERDRCELADDWLPPDRLLADDELRESEERERDRELCELPLLDEERLRTETMGVNIAGYR